MEYLNILKLQVKSEKSWCSSSASGLLETLIARTTLMLIIYRLRLSWGFESWPSRLGCCYNGSFLVQHNTNSQERHSSEILLLFSLSVNSSVGVINEKIYSYELMCSYCASLCLSALGSSSFLHSLKTCVWGQWQRWMNCKWAWVWVVVCLCGCTHTRPSSSIQPHWSLSLTPDPDAARQPPTHHPIFFLHIAFNRERHTHT